MTTDLNTLLTALYVKTYDWLGQPRRTGRPLKLSDAKLLTLTAYEQAIAAIAATAAVTDPPRGAAGRDR